MTLSGHKTPKWLNNNNNNNQPGIPAQTVLPKWLNRLLKLIPITTHQTHLGILTFEAAAIISKLLNFNSSLSDPSILHLKQSSITLLGTRKIVSDDDSFLLSLAVAELLHTLRLTAHSASSLLKVARETSLLFLGPNFDDFAESGRDQYGWVIAGRELEAVARRAERGVSVTRALYREMEALAAMERKKKEKSNGGDDEWEMKIVWRRNEVRRLKEKSYWNQSFDEVGIIIAKLLFSCLARIKLVFGIGDHGYVAALPRCLSGSSAATVFPDDDDRRSSVGVGVRGGSVSGPLKVGGIGFTKSGRDRGFFERNTKVLKAPSSTLGAAALALHYANLIIVIEKMVRSPQLVGEAARDDLYSMLPSSIRSSLRSRLRGVGFSASDSVLAREWKDALVRILGWLSPLAHNMIKWQSERSFEQHSFVMVPKTNVLLLQTLYFANKEKTEAAITELLVGLNYICRFGRQMMNAKTLLECSNFKGWPNMRQSKHID
ncbi:PSK SIMULATOR 3-like protein [Drosera capensis]